MSAVQPPISAPHFKPRFSNTTKPHIMVPLTQPRIKNPNFSWNPKPIYPIRVAEQSSNLVGDGLDNEQDMSVDQIREEIYKIVKDVNRGIFGLPSEKKSYIESLVKLLESQNPTPDPTLNLDKVGGCWKLIYSTIAILGSKRTKLGLRDFISLGDFYQTIDIAKGKAVNMIEFNVKGLNLLNGKLSIEASFKIASKSRVDISYENSSIVPEQLMNVFRKNYDLLLGIFNPEGWLEITYVDDTTRIGRDDKGNLFILEKSEENS